MRVSTSCFTSSDEYSRTVSGMLSVSRRKRPSSNMARKSRGTSSASCRQHRTRLARAPVSGTWWYSAISESSSFSYTLRGSAGLRHCTSTSTSFPFSSLASQSSSAMRTLPSTSSRPWPSLLPSHSAATGRFRGYDSCPDDSSAMAGRCTFSVAPYGYTNVAPPPCATPPAAAFPLPPRMSSAAGALSLPANRAIAWGMLRLSTPDEMSTSLGCRYL
mmetsp:Transcript_11399/g.24481  ORF Transcript_11399/g.24481 Transcript_11399/m.24481 type:complete len:217 (+) Transcript_11399:353-1003(+)